jgi:hypothetical protein
MMPSQDRIIFAIDFSIVAAAPIEGWRSRQHTISAQNAVNYSAAKVPVTEKARADRKYVAKYLGTNVDAERKIL